ncbi:MAG: hypothetical protein ACHQ6U_14045 [Thermodesulfobacteriota bacterium]
MQDLEDRLGVNLSSKNVKTSLDAEKVEVAVDAAKAGKVGPRTLTKQERAAESVYERHTNSRNIKDPGGPKPKS